MEDLIEYYQDNIEPEKEFLENNFVKSHCPDCDRIEMHHMAGFPVLECTQCMEPHDVTLEDWIIIRKMIIESLKKKEGN